LIEHLIA